jgi:hypothetical protein
MHGMAMASESMIARERIPTSFVHVSAILAGEAFHAWFLRADSHVAAAAALARVTGDSGRIGGGDRRPRRSQPLDIEGVSPEGGIARWLSRGFGFREGNGVVDPVDKSVAVRHGEVGGGGRRGRVGRCGPGPCARRRGRVRSDGAEVAACGVVREGLPRPQYGGDVTTQCTLAAASVGRMARQSP